MKKLILDYSKWRCGHDGPTKLGYGPTKLQNNHGYQCCLGQVSLQLEENLTNKDILNISTPAAVGKTINSLCVKRAYNETNIFSHENTEFAYSAMLINDNLKTTPEEKISELKELFLKHNYELEVINNK